MKQTLLLAAFLSVTLAWSKPTWAGDRPEDSAQALYEFGDLDLAGTLALKELKRGKRAYLAHEVLSWIADLTGDSEGAFDHALAAALDPRSDAPRFHLARLGALRSSPDRWGPSIAGLEELAAKTKDPGAAALALHQALQFAWRLGQVEAYQRLLKKQGSIAAWQVVAGFENDRKKGFDARYAPEEGVLDLEARYVGQKHEVTWREVAVLDESGFVPLKELESPADWSVAYLATWIYAPRRMDAVLQVTSSDPVKIWIHRLTVLMARDVEGSLAGHLEVPVRLFKGWNLVLVKSCQSTGAWFFGARIVNKYGALIEGLKFSARPHKQVLPRSRGASWQSESNLLARYDKVKGRTRREFIRAYMLYKEGFFKNASRELEEFLTRHHKSVPGRLMAALVAWSQGEHERLLGHFDEAVRSYPKLAEFLYQRANYFMSKGRNDRAMEDVDQALEASPDFRAARLLQARLYEKKRWLEEACGIYRLIEGQEKRWARLSMELAGCEMEAGRLIDAEKWYQQILTWWPTHSGAISALGRVYEVQSKYGAARELYQRWSQWQPHRQLPLLRLGELERSQKRWPEAAKAYAAVSQLSPELAAPYKELGEMAMERDEVAEARKQWNRALELNPEDYGLWERLERLAPEDAALLSRFAPGEEVFESIATQAGSSEVPAEASFVYLLDHEVTQLYMDGSVRRVVSQIIEIRDEIGRDMFSSFGLPRGGYVRVKKAYVLSPGGEHNEVSSLRDKTMRFRDLKPGSVVVLQYRHDTHGETFLNNHWHKDWNFQSSSGHTGLAEWVAILPLERPLKRHIRGAISEQISEVDGKRIYRWKGENLPPLKVQPVSPPVRDLASRVSVSTIPDWDFFARWEWAMVKESIRVTPELKKVAKELTGEAGTSMDKVEAVYDFVANKIRYVQDYESIIARMRPHSASTTFERKYGDCKDVSVLMVTLLKAAGIKAHYAGISTRRRGKTERSVPAQQYDHAIVYLPAQEGIAAPRFFDPTAEHLDIGNLPKLIQGQTAMVVTEEGHTFVPVPFSPPEHEQVNLAVEIFPREEEQDAFVDVTMTLRGEMGAQFRKTHTNPERFRQGMEGLLCGLLYPGGRLLKLDLANADSVRKPVILKARVQAPNVLTKEGDALGMTVLYPFNLAGSYAKWKDRRYPLYYGAATSNQVSMTVHLTESMTGVHLPDDSRVQSDCVDFHLVPSPAAHGVVRLQYVLKRTCTEVPAKRYQEHRKSLLEVSRILSEKIRFSVK